MCFAYGVRAQQGMTARAAARCWCTQDVFRIRCEQPQGAATVDAEELRRRLRWPERRAAAQVRRGRVPEVHGAAVVEGSVCARHSVSMGGVLPELLSSLLGRLLLGGQAPVGRTAPGMLRRCADRLVGLWCGLYLKHACIQRRARTHILTFAHTQAHSFTRTHTQTHTHRHMHPLPYQPPFPTCVLQGTLAAQEPLLSVRRQLALLLGDTPGAGVCWLQYAKLCRTMGACSAAQTRSRPFVHCHSTCQRSA